MESHPIFIVGMPRSGTTLLSSILSAHSSLVISPETHYFTKYYKHLSKLGRESVQSAFRHLMSTPEMQGFSLTADDVADIRESTLGASAGTGWNHAAFLNTLLRLYAHRMGCDRYGEKTPAHLEYVSTLLDLFPESKIIHIIRDPRDVSLSLRKVPWNKDNIVQHTYRWRSYNRLSLKYLNEFPNSFKEIRYEDLLLHPKCTITAACDFLGIPFESTMLDYYKSPSVNFDAAKEPWKRNTLQDIQPSNLEKWVREMNEYEKKVVDVLVSELLSYRGYPCSNSRWKVHSLLHAVFDFVSAGVILAWRKCKSFL